MTSRFPLHHQSVARLHTSADQAFSYLDDFKALSAHMQKRSAMMMGSAVRMDTDALGGRAVGSRVRMDGRVLGIPLRLEEVVTEREPPRRKAWETVAAKLLVIGGYRLGFELSPDGEGSMLSVFIDYDLPQSGAARWFGRLFGPVYARWCTEQMVTDAIRRFGGTLDLPQVISQRG